MNDPTTFKSFAEEVKAIPGGEFVELCFSCGTCTSQCMIQQKSNRITIHGAFRK